MINKRIIWFYVGFSIFLFGIVFRLFSIQVMNQDYYSSASIRQSIKRKVDYPKRGEIWDRNLESLIMNAKIEIDLDSNKKKLKRVALYNSLASQVLGTTGYNNQGQFGLEYHQDQILKGTNGWKYYRLNASRKLSPSLKDKESKAVNGKHVVTTLDKNIQEITESALKWGVNRTQALDGIAMIMDPHTGEILSLANYPFYHLNRKSSEDMKNWKNQAISKIYEPGSTMKIFTVAIALEENWTDFDEKFDAEDGQYFVDGIVVRDTKRNQKISLSEAMAHSSNIVIVKLANRFSSTGFYRYLRSFGFGNKTGISLPAEEKGNLKEVSEWSKRSKMTISWGQEIGTTPLQMLTAASVIANGGVLIQPQIIKAYVNHKNEMEEKNFPINIRRVITEKTAAKVRKLLEGVVQYGTARGIRNSEYTIGGKTGTVEKIDSMTGRYSEEKFNSSFIGMVPADNPKYIGIVIINEPKTHKYGGLSAAPVFKRIMDRMLKDPKYALDRKEKKILVTKLKTKKSINLAQVKLYSSKKGKNILEQSETKVMPNLVGLTLNEAIQKMKPLVGSFSYQGYGVVQFQEPRPNIVLTSNHQYKLFLK